MTNNKTCCFVAAFVLVLASAAMAADSVDIGDPTSEAAFVMTSWGPIEPDNSGGNYGGINHCRAIWSSLDGSVGECTTLDYVDIGDETSEGGHAMVGWGPIEPATSGGNYGGIDDCRPIYAFEDGDNWATIDLDFGNDPTSCKTLTIGHLDGLSEDTFDVYIDDVLVHTYAGDGMSVETWYELTLDVCLTGVKTVKFVSTAEPWDNWDIYGQMCFDFLKVEECQVGSPSATIDLNFLAATDELHFRHLEGIADDGFEVYVDGTLCHTHVENTSVEQWVESFCTPGVTGTKTVEFVATGEAWDSWDTYGQVCFAEIWIVEATVALDQNTWGNVKALFR